MKTLLFLSVLIFWNENSKFADGASVEEKLNMTTMEQIKAEGYHGEEYKVETPDGYIILLHRIPYGKDGPSNKKKTPVFIMHGVACESTVWIDQGEKSLAFLLANEGYDVWLGNMRGNRNSFHKEYSKDDPRFWDFTWDDHVKYDLPTMWDFVSNKTGFSKIYNIALSLGVWTSLANLADGEKYNHKFKGFFGMGPVTRLTYSTRQSYRILGFALLPLNAAEPVLLLPYSNKPDNPPSCSPNCTDPQLLYNKHCHSGTSFKAGLQGLQMTKTDKYSKFDYGNPFLNLIHYHSLHPPDYDLTKVSLPVSLYSAPNDDLADPIDVARLEMDLQNVFQHRIVTDDLFLHSDFIVHPDVDKYVYHQLIKDMKELE